MLKSSLLAMIALSASGAPTFAAENRLVPGKSAGEISIGETMNAVSKKLGQSDSGDGAMGHFWATWSAKSSLSTAKPNSLEIYAVRTRTGAKTLGRTNSRHITRGFPPQMALPRVVLWLKSSAAFLMRALSRFITPKLCTNA